MEKNLWRMGLADKQKKKKLEAVCNPVGQFIIRKILLLLKRYAGLFFENMYIYCDPYIER